MPPDTWKTWAKSLKNNIYALYLATRDPRVPWLAKLIIAVVLAYALSPIDLIPDFIPILGYLDDLVLLPLGIWLAIRLIPADIWQNCQAQATEQTMCLPRSRTAAAVIILIWLLVLLGLGIAWFR